MGLTSTFIQINALIGIVLPLLVAIVQQGHWSTRIRVVVEVALALVAAVVSALAQNKFNLHDWAASAIMIFVMAKSTYLSWNKAGITDAIELATSSTQSKQAIAHKKTLKKPSGSN